MDSSAFAVLLVGSENAERLTLLNSNPQLIDSNLAWVLKSQYDAARTKDPALASAIATTLISIAQICPDPLIQAIATWTSGRAALQIDGLPRQALELLDNAVIAFEKLNQPQHAATVQVTRLHGLALLGHYDQAIACGLYARDMLLAFDDPITAGTIEQNLGNIYHRRDQYVEAERFLRLAHQRFVLVDDQQRLAQIENCIAIELMYQHRFPEAAVLYSQALARAEHAALEVTQAEIETNLGNLALFQGQYDRALDFLERSRRRYATLGMASDLATVELELADVYLELNLVPEAIAIYARIIPSFRDLELQAELARALAHYGWAIARAGNVEKAHALLAEANALYISEHNPVGAAMATLFEAQVHYAAGEYTRARDAATRAEAPLREAQAWAWALFARWLCGDIERVLGHYQEAQQLLQQTHTEAGQHVVPQVIYRCHSSLGLIAMARGATREAETAFIQAVMLLEELRAPLPTEEFYTAFVADKLTPYAELVRICLSGSNPRITEAFSYVERARSRALVEMLGGALATTPKPRDTFEASLLARLTRLREELNWLYNQASQLSLDGAVTPSDLQASMRERELGIMEINRQLRQRSAVGTGMVRRAMPQNEITQLQHELGHDTVLVEYFAIDNELLAFVVDSSTVEVIRHLAQEPELERLVTQLHYQIDALRYTEEHLLAHRDQLTQRVQHYLQALYHVLIKPIEPFIGQRRLVVVPYRTLHYVPFHALHNGSQYLIEQREVCYVPSANILRHCLARPYRTQHSALLVGVADQQTPRIRDEIASIQALFQNCVALLDEQATHAALISHASKVDVLHLACHGQFRPDNPLFSSLRLGDGWLTVYDMYSLDLNCGLVTLSACETGVSAVAPGDELIGIARGFFASGTPSLLVSLWVADDDSTAVLMQTFYSHLIAGKRPAAALRLAQLDLLQHQPHPFFWSPFVILGRW